MGFELDRDLVTDGAAIMLLDFGAEQAGKFLPKIFAEEAGLLFFEALENLLAFTIEEREAPWLSSAAKPSLMRSRMLVSC